MTKSIKAIIAVLLSLIVVCLALLAARIIYINNFEKKSVTAVASDNVIGSKAEVNVSKTEDTVSVTSLEAEEVTEIKLYKGKENFNEKFSVQNMFPGDKVEKNYALQINHNGEVAVFFTADVTEQTKNLADVLNIKVTLTNSGKIIYNGSFADMDLKGYKEIFKADSASETLAFYKIEVSLPTSVGNEHQAAELTADFKWWVEDDENLIPPETRDTANVLLWGAVAFLSLLIIVFLFFFRIKKEEKVNE